MQITDEQRPMLRFLAVMTAASMVGLQGYTILFNNYAVEVVGLDGQGVGIIQSVRELPGFLALLAVFVMLVIKEHRLSALSILLLGLGTGITGLFPSYLGLACTTLVMSFGFHYFETTNQSLTLQYFSTGVAPLVFGRLRSLAAVSSIASGLLIWLLGMFLDYRGTFLIIGSLVLCAGALGNVPGADPRQRTAAAAADDSSAQVFPLLLSHLPVGSPPADIHGLFDVSAGEAVPLLGT